MRPRRSSGNPIVEGYPDTIEVNGEKRKVRTGFRYWMQLSRLLEDETVAPIEKMRTLYELTGLEPSDDPLADLDAAVGFLCRNEKGGRTKERTLDFDFDSGRIIASFQMQYGIDLTDPSLSMHWWRFLDLFAGLGNDTPILQAVRIREAELPGTKTKDERDRRAQLLEQKRRLAIPPKNSADVLRRDRDIWGD